jgi:hypothetical protein
LLCEKPIEINERTSEEHLSDIKGIIGKLETLGWGKIIFELALG